MPLRFLLALVACALGLGLAGCQDHTDNNPTSTVAAAPPLPPPTPASAPVDTSGAQHLPEIDFHIDQAVLHTQIAATGQECEIGLMHVAHLPDNDGMIFLLPEVTHATFWMKDTLIPLSVAFLDRNGTILEIHDMKPLDLSTTRSDSDQVAYALETNLHWFSLNHIKPGDHLTPPPATLGPPQP